jgi:acetolactate synthase-1/2/3 large subunit
LGAKVACPDRPVVAVCGDGGFMYNVQELATAVQHGINAVAVVFDDGAYGNVRRMQRALYGNRIIASDLRNPDFVQLASSFGMAAQQVTGPDHLAEALAAALARDEPALLTVKVGELPDPWHHIMLPKVRG